MRPPDRELVEVDMADLDVSYGREEAVVGRLRGHWAVIERVTASLAERETVAQG